MLRHSILWSNTSALSFALRALFFRTRPREHHEEPRSEAVLLVETECALPIGVRREYEMAVNAVRLCGREETINEFAANTSTTVVGMHVQLVETEVILSLP